MALAFLETAPKTILSITFFEANPLGLSRAEGEKDLDTDLRQMIAGFQAQVAAQDPYAAKTIIDYYGGAGFFDVLPEPARAYCTATAKVNALDGKLVETTGQMPKNYQRLAVRSRLRTNRTPAP